MHQRWAGRPNVIYSAWKQNKRSTRLATNYSQFNHANKTTIQLCEEDIVGNGINKQNFYFFDLIEFRDLINLLFHLHWKVTQRKRKQDILSQRSSLWFHFMWIFSFELLSLYRTEPNIHCCIYFPFPSARNKITLKRKYNFHLRFWRKEHHTIFYVEFSN